MEEITAKFIRESFRFNNEDGDVVIAEAVSDSGRITIKGPCEVGELLTGLEYRFFGRPTTYKNRRTGITEEQFAFTTFIRLQPATQQAVIEYLKQHGEGNGVGRGRAAQLWRLFGDQTIEICRTDPARVVAALSGVNIEQATNLAVSLKKDEAIEKVKLDLAGLLANRGFPKATTQQAIIEWGNKAAQTIRRMPYKLMKFKGCGFKRCDSMYLDLGLNPARMIRQALSAWYGLARDTEGHTWYPRNYCEAYIKGTISSAEVDTEKAITLAVRAKLLAEQKSEFAEDGWLAEAKKADNERQIATSIVFSKSESICWPDVERIEGITEHQREGLANALGSSIGILGGSPGTGKTWTVASLVECIGRTIGLEHVAIGAPTGKAAVRVTENLAARGLNLRAVTWHSMLNQAKKNGFFPRKILIGDESSMLDTDLMAAILRARSSGTHLLLVGDVNQLSPVGHGAPLRDLIASGVSYGELREIKRNSGGIVEACAAIRDQLPWQPGDNLEIDDRADQVQSILQQIEKANRQGLDGIWDCQVLVAVNEKSPLSRKELNKVLQAELNTLPGRPGIPFRVGDKVVNGKNGYFRLARSTNDQEVEKNEKGEVYIANGELGKVLSIDGSAGFIVELQSPHRIVDIRMAKDREEDSSGSSFELGYALSVHKAQGSDWPIALVVIDEYAGARMVCDRSWIYTGISRAKQKCVLVGKQSTAERFCLRSNIWKRKTFLRETILELEAIETLAGV